VMPVLARAKRVAGEKMENRALMADAVQSATCAYLAAVTLSGLLINALFHVRWVDPIAALVAIPIICIEGARALRGDACACCQ
jgi:divalent metal cation (Fe/Co/Zn/Cd) transporter